MVNITKLQEALRDKSVPYEEAAKAIGMDRSTFYRRLERKGSKFTVEEVEKLAKVLAMPPKQMQEIFFDQELA